MVVTIDGVGYVVARKQNSYLNVPLANGSTTTFRRNKAKLTRRLERDSEMQRRVQDAVTRLNTEQALLFRHTAHGTRHTAHGMRHTARGMRHAAHGTRHTALGTRHAAHGTRHTARGTRHAARGTRHTAHGRSASLPLSACVTLGPLHALCAQAANPASTQRTRSREGEAGKPSPDAPSNAGQPPKAKRQQLSPGAGTEPLPPSAAEAGPSEPPAGEERISLLRKLEKKIREIRRLQQQSRALTAEERVKVNSLSTVEAEAAALRVPVGWASAHPAAAASAAAAYANAVVDLRKLPALPPTQAGTRANHIAIEQRLAADRAALEAERVACRERADAAERDLLLMLRAPFDNWGNDVLWQLVMCEYALLHLDDVSRSRKQLQLDFRKACLEARLDVPRVHGSMQIDALQDALDASKALRTELALQLNRYKGLYCSMLSGFGRFKKLTPGIGESLLSLMTRTHTEARAWRPPGPTPAEKLALVSKEKGRFVAEWREDTWRQRHEAAGKTLSLRGTVGVSRAWLARMKNLPAHEVPAIEHPSTVRLHDIQAHQIQRSKALANTFSIKRCALQWDEVR